MKVRCFASALLLLLSLALLASGADTERAVITLGTNPEPPTCVPNPDGEVLIFWEIQHQTTPDSVTYELRSPSLDLIEHENYPGNTGLAVDREWTVPSGSEPGGYLVKVSYYSVEVGNEANAEVIFLVCDPTVPVREADWGRIKSLFRP